jgi:endonuclease/exonuclease/phosphatase family metal-dependent hydrolase
MYRTDRFEQLDSGHFWLSETPDVPGSKSWDSSLPRMLSWVVLQDRRAPQRPFVFANVHFDHRGLQARLESARLLRQRAADLQEQFPIVLTGDFNTTEDDPPYAVLVGGQGFGNLPFVDAYRVIHPERSPHEASFSNWTGVRQGSRIDWIVHTPHFHTLNATINYTQEGGRYPSDHYPVEAVVRLK